MADIKKFRTETKNYIYSYSFSTDRKLTHDEIMTISDKAMKCIQDIISKETGIKTENHNCSSGIENR